MSAEQTTDDLDPRFLDATLETSTRRPYQPPSLTVRDFVRLIEAFNRKQENARLAWEQKDNVYRLRVISTASHLGTEAGQTLSTFEFATLELEDGKLAVYLQTVDRGPDYLLDEDRFIPSDAVVEMIRMLLQS